MPPKPDLTFIDEHFESGSVDVVSNVASSDEDDKPKSKAVKKTVEFKTVKQDEVPDGKLKKKIVVPTAAKIEFVRPKQQEKPVRKPVKYAEMYRSQRPRGNQRNWNN
ncbi:hypothetical protein Tco_1285468 [Tanacetum coccineum]